MDDLGVAESLDGDFWVLWSREGSMVSLTLMAKATLDG